VPPVEREHGRMLAGRDNFWVQGYFVSLFYAHFVSRNDGGGGGSRSATIIEFSNDFDNSKGWIRRKRQKAPVQVQNRYSGSAGVTCEIKGALPATARMTRGGRDQRRLECDGLSCTCEVAVCELGGRAVIVPICRLVVSWILEADVSRLYSARRIERRILCVVAAARARSRRTTAAGSFTGTNMSEG
jgi:hypothetical protein